VQELVEQAVRDSGHRVLVTRNALEVLDVARRIRIDLLVLDIDAHSGLVEEVRKSQPDVGVLYLAESPVDQPAGPGSGLLLLRPFSLSALRAGIAAGLHRPESAASGGAGTER
jgi:DNA-binding response OmpR family regulator